MPWANFLTEFPSTYLLVGLSTREIGPESLSTKQEGNFSVRSVTWSCFLSPVLLTAEVGLVSDSGNSKGYLKWLVWTHKTFNFDVLFWTEKNLRILNPYKCRWYCNTMFRVYFSFIYLVCVGSRRFSISYEGWSWKNLEVPIGSDYSKTPFRKYLGENKEPREQHISGYVNQANIPIS